MRSFGHLERDVMRVIWRATEPVTGHDIAAQLPAGRDIAYTTLITVVDRLRDKGLLSRFRDGRSFRYQAAVTEEEYAADLMAQALNSSDDRSKALLQFAGRLDPDEVEALRAALASTSEEHDTSRRPQGQP